MSARRLRTEELPSWPLWLTRELAAAYVGVSPDVFDLEVEAGLWPAAVPRGAKGGRLTWHRPALDDRSEELAPSTRRNDLEARRREYTQGREARRASAR